MLLKEKETPTQLQILSSMVNCLQDVLVSEWRKFVGGTNHDVTGFKAPSMRRTP